MDERNNNDQPDRPTIEWNISPSNFNPPTCILRTPGSDGSNIGQSAQTWTRIFTPPVYRPPIIQNEEPTEKQDTADYITCGLLNGKHPLHMSKDDIEPNVYTHRLSYNTLADAYYENGNLDREYIKTWKEGALRWNNIDYKREYDWNKVYLARDPRKRRDEPGEICWEFDYRPGDFVISKLSLKLQHTIFDDNASVLWTVTALPSRNNTNPIPQTIEFEPASSYPHSVDARKDVTLLAQGQYGFVLRALLSGGINTNISWQRTQIFRRSTISEFDDNDSWVHLGDDDSGINFGLDVRVELVPDVICEPLPEVKYGKEGKGNELVLNDKETSDFVVHLEIPGEKEDDPSHKEIRDFHVHCNVLSARSDYFKALFDSHMVESREKSVTLSDISFSSFKTILEFIYNCPLPDINSYDEWVELLHGASRFLIPTLVQRCEKGIRKYLDSKSVEDIEAIAKECGANQLLRCCEMLKVEE